MQTQMAFICLGNITHIHFQAKKVGFKSENKCIRAQSECQTWLVHVQNDFHFWLNYPVISTQLLAQYCYDHKKTFTIVHDL